MPATMHCQLNQETLGRTTIRRVVHRLAMICCVVSAVGLAWADDPLPIEGEKIFIAYLVDFEAPPSIIDSVRMSFEIVDIDAAEEAFTLAIFDAATESLLVATPMLVEQQVTVDSFGFLKPGEIWIDEPPVPMQWVEVALETPLLADTSSMLFAIGMTNEQLRRQTGLIPHLEAECAAPRTYFSEDDGLSWWPLDSEALKCLRVGICEDNGSTNLRINVRPC